MPRAPIGYAIPLTCKLRSKADGRLVAFDGFFESLLLLKKNASARERIQLFFLSMKALL